MKTEKKYEYSSYFNFGAEEKYVADLIDDILNFYRQVLPLVEKDITLSVKYKDQEDNKDCFFVSVVLLENNIYNNTGETAFELCIAKGDSIYEALEQIKETIKFAKTGV